MVYDLLIYLMIMFQGKFYFGSLQLTIVIHQGNIHWSTAKGIEVRSTKSDGDWSAATGSSGRCQERWPSRSFCEALATIGNGCSGRRFWSLEVDPGDSSPLIWWGFRNAGQTSQTARPWSRLKFVRISGIHFRWIGHLNLNLNGIEWPYFIRLRIALDDELRWIDQVAVVSIATWMNEWWFPGLQLISQSHKNPNLGCNPVVDPG